MLKGRYVKCDSAKKLQELVVGDILKRVKDGEVYRLEGISIEEDRFANKATYYNFGSFLVHESIMRKMFKTYYETEESRKVFLLYEQEKQKEESL